MSTGVTAMENPAECDLDSLIHSLVYENQQYVKMIKQEDQRIAYLESELTESNTSISELQANISQLEAETKQMHKQLVHNKDTIQSLKSTKSVQQAHMDALTKQLGMIQFENKQQKQEFEDTIKMYEKTWTEYEATYKSMALYKVLVEEEAKLAHLQTQRNDLQQLKNTLQNKLQAAQDEQDFRDWRKFCVRIAEKKQSVERRKQELMSAIKDKESLQAKLREIRENNVSSLFPTHLDTALIDTDMETEEDDEEDESEEESSETTATTRSTSDTNSKDKGGNQHHVDDTVNDDVASEANTDVNTDAISSDVNTDVASDVATGINSYVGTSVADDGAGGDGGDAVVTGVTQRRQQKYHPLSFIFNLLCFLLLAAGFLLLEWVCEDSLMSRHFFMFPFLCPLHAF